MSGKSWLLRDVAAEVGGTYASLDRPSDLRAARTDPTGFASQGGDGLAPLFIDEVQRAGDQLVLSIKADVDLGSRASAETRRETMARVVRGGFPEAVLARSDRDRTDWFADYVRTISQRDIVELSRLSDRVDLRPRSRRRSRIRSTSPRWC